MIDYTYNELVRLGFSLMKDSRGFNKVPKDIQQFFGELLLALPDEMRESIRMDAKAELERYDAEYRKELAKRFADFD